MADDEPVQPGRRSDSQGLSRDAGEHQETPTTELPASPPDPPAGDHLAPAGLVTPAASHEEAGGLGPDTAVFEALGADEDDEWPLRSPRRGVSMRIPTAVLLALLVAAGAFWAGAAVQRSQSGTAGGGFSGFAARLRAAAARGAGGQAGGGGFAGLAGSGPTASGIVTVIAGKTLYLTNASGAIVKVEVGPTATITRDASANEAALRPGDTVVVEGTTAKSGVVTAT